MRSFSKAKLTGTTYGVPSVETVATRPTGARFSRSVMASEVQAPVLAVSFYVDLHVNSPCWDQGEVLVVL